MRKITDTQQHPKVDIAVRNFGPIAEAAIDLRPLTVFVGPSNTGKTYFSTLVYALHSAFDGFAGFPIPFLQDLLAEIAYDLRHSPSEFTPEVRREIRADFEKLDTKGGTFKFSDLPQPVRARLQNFVSERFKHKVQDELKNCFDLNSISALRRLTGEQHNEMTVSLKVSEGNQECWNMKARVSEKVFSPASRGNHTTTEIGLDGPANVDMIFTPVGWSISWDSLRLPSAVDWVERNLYYLPAARSGIMQSHRVIVSSLVQRATRVGVERFPEVPTLSGAISEFMQHIILYEENKIPNDAMRDIAEALESDVLAGQIRVDPSPSGYPDFRYRPQGVKAEMRLSQASSMVSELAPLVLFLRGLIRPGDTLIIEEPEAHLHPGAQTEMAATLGRLVRAGVRVVVTTHSDWLLKEIGNLIREGSLREKGVVRGKTNRPERWLLPVEVGAWQFHTGKPVEAIQFTNIDGIEPDEYDDLAENLYNRSAGLHNQLEEAGGLTSSEYE